MKRFVVHSIVVMFVLVLASNSWANTFVQGAVFGKWDLQGSPYNVIDDCTIDNGQELIIHPGVSVIIGEGLSITANGKITAVGTPGQRIAFRSPNTTIYWKHIKVVNGSETKTSRFEYCDLSNAENAIFLEIGNYSNATMITKIINCKFSNCLQNGI